MTDGLKLWLDATDRSTLTFNGAEVTQWDDKSGNDNHATAGASKRPQLAMGGIGGKRDALGFSRDQMTVNGLTIGDGDPRTIFVMLEYNTLAIVTRLAIKHRISSMKDKLTLTEKRRSGRKRDGWN